MITHLKTITFLTSLGSLLLVVPCGGQGFVPGHYFDTDFTAPNSLVGDVQWHEGVWDVQDGLATQEGFEIRNASVFSVLAPRDVTGTSWLSYRDASLRTQLRLTSPSGQPALGGLMARGANEVYGGWINHEGTLRIVESLPGDGAIIHGEFDSDLDAFATDVLLQFDQRGEHLELYAWEFGSSKPTLPQISTTDLTLTTGTFGVLAAGGADTDGVAHAGSVIFRWAEVAPVPEPAADMIGLIALIAVSGYVRRLRGRMKGQP